jgi:hypothetical protein
MKTLTVTESRAEVNHGSTEYWISYAEDIINRTNINQPWLSEIKCAEIGIATALKEGHPRAIELSSLLFQKKSKNDYKIHLDK